MLWWQIWAWINLLRSLRRRRRRETAERQYELRTSITVFLLSLTCMYYISLCCICLYCRYVELIFMMESRGVLWDDADVWAKPPELHWQKTVCLWAESWDILQCELWTLFPLKALLRFWLGVFSFYCWRLVSLYFHVCHSNKPAPRGLNSSSLLRRPLIPFGHDFYGVTSDLTLLDWKEWILSYTSTGADGRLRSGSSHCALPAA